MRIRFRALCLCLALSVFLALPGGAQAAIRQRSVELDAKLVTIDLAEGNTFQLGGKVLPEGASQRIVWRSSKKSVATVSGGLITAYRIGKATISARPYTRSTWAKASVQVTDSLSPSSITLNATSMGLRVGSTYQLSATVLPDTAIQTLRYATSRSSVATVTQDGLITARRAGTAIIRAISTRNAAMSRAVRVVVKNLPVPKKFLITPADKTIERGETLQLFYAVSPSDANPSAEWSSSNRAVASVDQTGLVTARKVGAARIRIRSRVNLSIYTIRTIKVVDTKTVTKVVITGDDSVLLEGGALTLTAQVLPVTADQSVSWSSNNASVATVSGGGVVTGHSAGSATITASAGAKSDTQRVVVMDLAPVKDLPDQITSVSGLNANLAKIDDILRYATAQVDALKASGSISSSEATARKKILLNAFRMARFPWMSSRAVTYWSGGSNKYLANVVYYGIPYTQWYRTYNTSKILKTSAFKASGEGYYTANMKNRSYPGNDCSAFVSMSIWGTGSSLSYLRSWEIKKSTAYKTVATKSRGTAYLNLRPGDFFVRNGHVAMFLYYVNSLHSRIMIIQQGGLDALNTVSCTIKPLSFYSGDSRYVARRKKSFA